MRAVEAVGDRIPELVVLAVEDVKKGMTFWGHVERRDADRVSLMAYGALVESDAHQVSSGSWRFEYDDLREGPLATWLEPGQLVLVEAAGVS
jgi:hypothetical protein